MSSPSDTILERVELALPYDQVDWDVSVDAEPQAYVSGSGLFGVHKYQPYADRYNEHWSIDTVEQARADAEWLYDRFEHHVERDQFPGADMARKYLRMGWSRAMRYAKYPGGDKSGHDAEYYHDPQKREIATTYKRYWDRVQDHEAFERLEAAHESGDLYE